MKYKIIFLLLFVSCFLYLSAADFPKPTGWVNDFSGKLSTQLIDDLTSKITELKEKTNVEIAVAILPDIGGRDYNEAAVKLFREWGVGNKDNEGVLILVAVQERKIKIEVGYGSEGYVTDLISNQVYQLVAQSLSTGAYDTGISNGVNALLSVIATEKGVSLEGVSAYNANQGKDRTRNSKYGSILLLIIFIFLMIITRGRILIWLLLFSNFGGGGRRGGGFGDGSGGFGGFGGFGGGSSGGGGAGGGF